MSYREVAIDSGYYGGDYDPDYDDPEPPEFSACPNCGTETAIQDGVAYFCVSCGALWERCDFILTAEEEAAFWNGR